MFSPARCTIASTSWSASSSIVPAAMSQSASPGPAGPAADEADELVAGVRPEHGESAVPMRPDEPVIAIFMAVSLYKNRTKTAVEHRFAVGT